MFEEQAGCCALSGYPLEFAQWAPRGQRKKAETTASLDRINSDVGYVPGNVQWVHKTLNVAKHTSTTDEFVAMCRAVVQHLDQPRARRRAAPAGQLRLLKSG